MWRSGNAWRRRARSIMGVLRGRDEGVLAGELAIGQDDGSGLACGGDALGGIEGIEVEDVALGERLAETGEIDHGSAPRAGRGRPGPEGTPTRGSTPRLPRSLTSCPTWRHAANGAGDRSEEHTSE